MQVLYVNPMEYEANPAVDAIAHGLEYRLAQADIELRVAYADFRDEGWPQQLSAAVEAGIESRMAAIVLDAPGIGMTLGDLVGRKLVGGQELDGEVAVSPIGPLIDAENVARWIPWTERVPYAPLKVGLAR